MLEAGAIEEVPGEPGPRRRRVYGLTGTGAAELREWLSAPPPEPGARSEALLHAVLLGQLEPARRPRRRSPPRPRATASGRRSTRRSARRRRAGGSPLAPLRLAFDCGARVERALAEWAEAAAAERGRARAARARPPRPA